MIPRIVNDLEEFDKLEKGICCFCGKEIDKSKNEQLFFYKSGTGYHILCFECNGKLQKETLNKLRNNES